MRTERQGATQPLRTANLKHVPDSPETQHWADALAPLTVAVGILLTAPLPFICYCVYDSQTLALGLSGVGLIALVAGIGHWIGDPLAPRQAAPAAPPAAANVIERRRAA